MRRIVLHIDVNNAFLSWTAIDLLKKGYHKDLRNAYAVIGGDEQKRHGIVLAKSPLAKQKGIVTAEPLASARRKCPGLEIYPPNYLFYQQMSNALFTLLSQYSPDIEVFSIDECFMEYTHVQNLYGDPLLFAEKISKQIKQQLGFTVNIGIANNKLCAKMASDFSKPDKIHTLWQEEIPKKMWPLPIEELFGIGKKTSAKLRDLGITTIGSLLEFPFSKLEKCFKNQALIMVEKARGIDNSPVLSTEVEAKGISNTTTLDHDVIHKEELYPILQKITENVTLSLRRQGKYAFVVAVILKDNKFRNMTHQRKLTNATNLTSEVANLSKKLLEEMWTDVPIRLVGIRLDNLTDKVYHQESLFEPFEERKEEATIEKVVDELKEKYGSKVIKKAALVSQGVTKKYQK